MPAICQIAAVALLTGSILALASCGNKTAPPAGSAAAAGERVSDAAGFSFVMPADWRTEPAKNASVPGRLCQMLVPQGFPKETLASITIFAQTPGQEFAARYLLDMSVSSLQLPGFEVRAKEIRPVAGMTAMWLEDMGPGNGGAVTTDGTVPTAQIWAGIPRGKEILCLLLTTPEANLAADKATFEALVKDLQVSGEQTEAQKASV